MVAKRKTKPRKRMRGGAWYNDLWDGVKSVISPINDIAKATRIGSTIANATGNPAVGAVLGSLGYGRRKRIGGHVLNRSMIISA